MFGDIGHCGAYLIIGTILCLFNNIIKEKLPSLAGFLYVRYLLLLMGLSATFCGIVYNDFMAIPMWFFDSCYDMKEV